VVVVFQIYEMMNELSSAENDYISFSNHNYFFMEKTNRIYIRNLIGDVDDFNNPKLSRFHIIF